jgi:hypothetical protein
MRQERRRASGEHGLGRHGVEEKISQPDRRRNNSVPTR